MTIIDKLHTCKCRGEVEGFVEQAKRDGRWTTDLMRAARELWVRLK